MRKILFIVILILVCTALTAQVTYNGSARVGFWYDMTDEDYNYFQTGIKQNRTSYNQSLQEDSHLGINITHWNLTAKAEFGYNSYNNSIKFDYLWARRDFRNWAVVVGRDDFGSRLLANQAYRSGLGLDGYGGLTTGPVDQVRLEVRSDRDLFYLAFIKPEISLPVHFTNEYVLIDPTPGIEMFYVDRFMPRIMIGYNVRRDYFTLKPMFMYQAFMLNSDLMANNKSYDNIKVSWLFAVTNEFHLLDDRLNLRLHAHHGQNIGNMGMGGDFSRMVGEIYIRHAHSVPTLNTAHALCIGAHFTASYDFCENFNMTAGIGYATSSTTSDRITPDDWFYKHHDDRLAFYLQGVKRINNFSIIPEFGMFFERKNQFGWEQGNKMYIGTQLRFDF